MIVLLWFILWYGSILEMPNDCNILLCITFGMYFNQMSNLLIIMRTNGLQ